MRSTVAALVLSAAAILILGVNSARGFDGTGVGAKIGVVNPDEGDASLVVGAHMEFTEVGSRWHLMPEVLFWKDADNVSDLSLNANVFYHFQPEVRTSPYLGFGVNLNFFTIDIPGDDDHETDLGLNLMGGMMLPVSSSVRAFFEGRYVATELDHIMLLGGLTIEFGQ